MAEKAYGTLNGHTTEFFSAHREVSGTSSDVDVTLTVPLSYEDITALLYILVTGGTKLAELDDAVFARWALFDTLLHESASRFEDAVVTIEEAERGTAEYALIQDIRTKVAATFAPVSAPDPSRERRELAGVSA